MSHPAPSFHDAVNLQEMIVGYWKTQALHVAVKLGIPDALAGGAMSAEELAAKIDAHPHALERLLRALASIDIVTCEEPNRYALTSLGMLLCKDNPAQLHVFFLLGGGLFWDSWGDLLHAVKTGESSFAHVHGHPVYEHLEENTEQAATFNAAMSSGSGAGISAIVEAYDFTGFARIVDVGGGHGALLGEILVGCPQAEGVLVDLPSAIHGARRMITSYGLEKRCECIGLDFFQFLPAGDAYVMGSIVHNWDDERAGRLLANCRQSITPEGRLLLIERVLDSEESGPLTAFNDLHMLVIFGGRERTEAEFQTLLEKSGFELLRVIPTGTPRSILEARPV